MKKSRDSLWIDRPSGEHFGKFVEEVQNTETESLRSESIHRRDAVRLTQPMQKVGSLLILRSATAAERRKLASNIFLKPEPTSKTYNHSPPAEIGARQASKGKRLERVRYP
jgi:hypothetical protein